MVTCADVWCCCLQLEVQNADDVVALMARGASQRATSETKMNDRSSRSHQILTVIVDGFNTVTKAASHGCLHLIDLAGSERVGKSEASGAAVGCMTGVTATLPAQCSQP
jgi:kinesin family protein C2/C3